MTFPFVTEDATLSGGQTGGQIGGQIDGVLQIVELAQRQNQVLNNIKEDSTISRPTEAKQINSNKSAVMKHLEIVKEKGMPKTNGRNKRILENKKE